MELRAKKSRIHLCLILLILFWGTAAIVFSDSFLLSKVLLLSALYGFLLFELRVWMRVPEVISVRTEKLFLRSPEVKGVGSELMEVKLGSCRAHLFWLKLPVNNSFKAQRAQYLFRDSFERSDWYALRRAILQS